jgi:DNA polymerase-1
MPDDPPTLLVDSHSLLFRSFHGLPPLSTSWGAPTSALYGFLSLLLKLMKERRPGGLAFALDAPGPTFRHEAMEGYKAGRAPLHPELVAQLVRFEEVLEAFACPAFRVPGYEADDVLATLAVEGPAVVASGDRDLFQVVTEDVEVAFVGRRGGGVEAYDLAAVRARYGIEPLQLPSYVALVGDPADNLPKVPGVGPKTASRWVAAHGTIDGVLAARDALAPARSVPALVAMADTVRRSERLATLVRDVPLPDGPRSGRPSLRAVDALLGRLEMASLQRRLATIADLFE